MNRFIKALVLPAFLVAGAAQAAPTFEHTRIDPQAPLLAEAGTADANSTVVASSRVAIAGTDSGQVQGFLRDGIFTFKGIPYATAERFMPPVRVQPWDSTRMALSFGYVCPQPINLEAPPQQVFLSDWRFWPTSENCQNLNLWSPGINDGKKRPVLVWLHGGGFFSGSSMDLPIYDGNHLAKGGDVVVVSVNHRLNVLGFLDLSVVGDDFKFSGNVGMLDIVAALEWVKRNVAQFGGDPANVTIFGQSGGGAKVATLMTTPAAKGLFHKAIIQSGAPGAITSPASDRKVAKRIAELVFQNAGIPFGETDKLQAIPYAELMAASDKALATATAELNQGKPGPGGFSIMWAPVVDGDFLPASPFATAAPAVSKGVPLLVGSTLAEFEPLNPAISQSGGWNPQEVKTYLRGKFGDSAGTVYAAFEKAYPELQPRDWLKVDARFRGAVLRTAELKAAQGDPVYSYLFAWRSPILDYFWAAGHTCEVAFVFNNPQIGEQSTGGGPEVVALAEKTSTAWINFARHGNPNHPGLPTWPRYTAAQAATMILDDDPDVRIDHDSDLMQLLSPTP